ncbi:MAG: TetR family transcriptional regulator [Colwellia sp.]|nr:TetR family transcriptional regulator [Colwellia sp.]MCW8863887.1 TetR family transcriptional regulator [Colwellia sp.]MCW9081169.1 TetR family transcriptional regulator [Colwellia sp.]
MTVSKSNQVIKKPKTSKSEITRQKIVDATLDLIADEGLAGLSHRKIAARAEVKLSLLNYYFGTLDNLIEAAFDIFYEADQEYNKVMYANLNTILGSLDEQDKSEIPLTVKEQAIEVFSEYLQKYYTDSRKEIRIKFHFVYFVGDNIGLMNKANKFKTFLLSFIESFLTRLGGKQPKTDAFLLLCALREIQFAYVLRGEKVDNELLIASIRRLVIL